MATELFGAGKIKKSHLIYTILIYLNNFAYGISGNMIGAVLVDLSFIYGTSLNTISYIQCAAGAGYLIGSFGSFLYRHVNRQFVLIYGMFQWTICITLMPHYGHLWLAFAMTSAMTIATGAWDSSTSIWVVEMWPIGNSALLQGLQFMYGLGSIVAPLLCAPFVYGTKNVTEHNQTITPEFRIESLTVPFAINGGFQILFPILFLIMFFASRYEKKQVSTTEENLVDGERVAIPWRKTKIAIMGFCVATYVASEFGYVAFATAMYQYLDIHLSAPLSARVQSIMSTSFTLGRLITAFISLKVKPDIILCYHYVLLIGSIVFIYFGRDNLTMIYAGNVILGFGFSAIWPGLFAFTEHFLHLTDRVCTVFAFFAGSACLIIPLVLGQVFHSYPIILIIVIGVFTIISFALFIFVRVWIFFNEKMSHRQIAVRKNKD